MILALNSAEKKHEMALLDSKILAEIHWPDQRNDLEILIPTLDKLLKKAKRNKEEITDIAVVQGPGPFTSLRAGIAAANALAEALGARLHSIDTFTLLRLKANLFENLLIVLNAGGIDIGLVDSTKNHEVKIGPLAATLAKYPHGKFHVVTEVSDIQEIELHPLIREKNWIQIEKNQLKTLAQVIAERGLNDFNLVDQVEAYYLKGAHITVTKDPWKKANNLENLTA